jgi:hypothetical protein
MALHTNMRFVAEPSPAVIPKKSHLVDAGQPALVNAVHVSLQMRSVPPSGPGVDEPRQAPAPHAASVTHGCRQIPTPVDVSQTSGDSHCPFTHSSPSRPRVAAWQLP